MINSYSIKGMTCGNCVAKVTKLVEAIPGVNRAEISLAEQGGVIDSNKKIALADLRAALKTYQVDELESAQTRLENASISIRTYKPLILIILFISGVSFLAQFPLESFDPWLWMRHFMAGFFIVFAFFKLLNLEGFATSYAMYDLIAARWKVWGYIYPFVELILGVLYLTGLYPFWTNLATVVILGISSLGVIQSNLQKRKIKCACLGDVFNLPMSTVTIVEDLAMVTMALVMLLV